MLAFCPDIILHLLVLTLYFHVITSQVEHWSSRDACFWIENDALSWSAARSTCLTHGADLAWIEDGRDLSDVMIRT